MVHATITAERIIVSFDFFHLMAPARMYRHNYMDVVTQWQQGVHWESNITRGHITIEDLPWISATFSFKIGWYSILHKIVQLCAMKATLCKSISIICHPSFWKHKSFLSFHRDQQAVEVITLSTLFLFLSQNCQMESKELPSCILKISEMMHHSCWATT